jgi:hypothetical protein
VAHVDRELGARIAELQVSRGRLAELPSAERLCVPDDVASLLQELREIGVSERTVRMERDAWILLTAAVPDMLDQAVQWKRAILAHPDYRRLLLDFEDAFDWSADDPRLVELAERGFELLRRHYPVSTAEGEHPSYTEDKVTYQLVSEYDMDASPAWLRLNRMIEDLAREHGYPVP